MGSSVTAAELNGLRENPDLLESELRRYAQLRDDVESKLRAVVDETSGREYLERAERELHRAEAEVEKANARAGEIIENATRESAAMIAKAGVSAMATTSRADEEAAALVRQAKDELARASALRSEAEEKSTRAERIQAEAEAAIARSAEATKHYVEGRATLSTTRQRLADLVNEMQRVLGDAG